MAWEEQQPCCEPTCRGYVAGTSRQAPGTLNGPALKPARKQEPQSAAVWKCILLTRELERGAMSLRWDGSPSQHTDFSPERPWAENSPKHDLQICEIINFSFMVLFMVICYTTIKMNIFIIFLWKDTLHDVLHQGKVQDALSKRSKNTVG